MALSIKIVTTNGITRQFYQSDSGLAQALIDRLQNSSNIFSSPSLVISSDLQTEIFSSKYIVAIELESEQNMAIQLPSADLLFQAVDSAEDGIAYDLDFDTEIDTTAGSEAPQNARVEFYFVGGHKVATEVVVSHADFSLAKRTNRITRIFEQPVIYYLTTNAGIGLLNPHVMTRAVVTPCTLVLPTDAIIVDDY